jgi:hypothetical protein
VSLCVCALQPLSFIHEQDYNQKAALSDIDSLQTISIQTFKETFAAVNTPENLSNYISQSFNVKQLELTNPDLLFI